MTDQPTSPPPAYFLSLSLENVRSFGEKQTISFADKNGRPAQWTIILGDNGVGKTTVLKALAGLSLVSNVNSAPNHEDGLKIDLSEELRVPKSADVEPAYLKLRHIWSALRTGRQSKGAIIKSDLFGLPPVVYNNPLFTMARMECIAEAGKRLLGRKHEIAESLNYVLTARFVGNESIGRGWSSIPNNLTGLFCYGYGAGRTVGNSTIGDNTANTDTYISLFDDRADLLNPEEWFLNIDYGSKLAGENAGQLNKARTLVEEMLKTVLPGVTELRIASTGTPQKPQISLQFLLFDTWVRLRDMSLGYQTLVVWLTDFASKLFIRYPDSANPLEEPAIVLIDEIDLHLHPSWQRKLIGFLSGIFKNTQFIATAHSPLVVQAAGDAGANVVLLRREGDQTKVYENPVDVRNWRVDQILTSTFFNLETARSVESEKRMARQATLLNKARLSAKERRELDALTLELEGEPMGSVDGEEDEEAMLRELTRRAGKRPKA